MSTPFSRGLEGPRQARNLSPKPAPKENASRRLAAIIPWLCEVRYTKTPRHGRTIAKITQPALPKSERLWRRMMFANTVSNSRDDYRVVGKLHRSRAVRVSRAMGERLGGFIYGTIIVLAVVVAGAKAYPHAAGHIAALVAVTSVVFWLAHVYAHGLARVTTRSRLPSAASNPRCNWRPSMSTHSSSWRS